MKAKDVPKGKGAWTVKVGEKGQIVIPKDAREMFEIHPGDTLMLLADDKKRDCDTTEIYICKFVWQNIS